MLQYASIHQTRSLLISSRTAINPCSITDDENRLVLCVNITFCLNLTFKARNITFSLRSSYAFNSAQLSSLQFAFLSHRRVRWKALNRI
jgi:hypothetical protein